MQVSPKVLIALVGGALSAVFLGDGIKGILLKYGVETSPELSLFIGIGVAVVILIKF